MNTHADGPADGQAITSAHTLTALQQQFPRYRIWEEACGLAWLRGAGWLRA